MAMTPHPSRGSARRRAMTFVAATLAFTVLAAGIGMLLADRYAWRIDLSVAGGQRLAPRTVQLLRSLESDVRLVVATDLSLVDRDAKERLVDVLDEFGRTSTRVTSSVIDTGSEAGAQAYRDLVSGMIEAESAAIEHARAKVAAARERAAVAAAWLASSLGPGLQELEAAEAAGGESARAARDYFNQTAAAVRLAARDLDQACAKAAESLAFRLADRALPRCDDAAEALAKGLVPIVPMLEALVRESKAYVARAAPERADGARRLAAEVQVRRDEVAVLIDAMRRLERPDVLRVVDSLGGGAAALVIGEPGKGLVALDVEALVPSAAWLEASGADTADQSRRVEELWVTGIGAMQRRARPIVVFVHGEPREFLREAPILTQAMQRLESRGIDVVEWACVANPTPPSLAALDSTASRPVAWIVMSPDSTAESGARGGTPGLSGVQRCERVGKAIEGLVAAGEAVCVAINPSIVATYGDVDPIVAAIAPLGVAAETGKPLMRSQVAGAGRTIVTDMVVQTAASGHPLAEAIRGLPTTLPWSIALRAAAAGGEATVTPLLTLPADAGLWGESQWLGLWQTPRERRQAMAELPKLDAGRDLAEPPGGTSWIVVAASERRLESGRVQRAVVVGSNSWLIDQVAARAGTVDGRRVALSPGNLELFENVVWHLCGRDELIARSAAAGQVAMVQPIAEGTLGRMRLAIVIGLPVLLLLAGVLHRAWRG